MPASNCCGVSSPDAPREEVGALGGVGELDGGTAVMGRGESGGHCWREAGPVVVCGDGGVCWSRDCP